MIGLIGIEPLADYQTKFRCEMVCVEYQKNALDALLRRFMGGPGIRTFISYQINFKRITIAPEDKKEAIRYTVKNRGKGGGKTPQKQGKKRRITHKRGHFTTIDKALGIKYRATK